MPTIQSVTNPFYANAENTIVNCTIVYEGSSEAFPYTASPNDPEQSGRDLYEALIAGTYGPIAAYTPPPPPTPQQIQNQNKTQATALLKQTDWTSIADVGNPQVSNPYLMNQTAFLAYRSQVRAIAVNPPTTPAVFPTQPTEQWSS
jgi:hypothetical protein